MTARMPLHSISPKARRFKRQNAKKKKEEKSFDQYVSLVTSKKKKYNDNNNKKERFVRNRSANLSPTHARIHTYTCLLFFFHYYYFFFFRPLGVPRRVEKWGSENGKTTKMWHGRWSGLGGTGGRVEERERVGKTSSRRRRMNFNSARAK